MSIRLYDTAAREKRVFKPQDPKRVTMYVCGPTVYNRAHIGNFRPVMVFDTLFRLLRKTYGAEAVIYARNVTDIEDKIIATSQETGESIEAITRKYAGIYDEDAAAVNALVPTIVPWATEHVGEMVQMIEALERKGYAYATDAGVFFNVPQMEEYGRLSGRKLEDNEAGARVAVDLGKRNPADFALWKFAKPGEPEDAIWDSKWGVGARAGLFSVQRWRPNTLVKPSTFMAAVSIYSFLTTRMRSRNQSARMARQWPIIGCIMASSIWPERRCPSLWAMSFC